MKKDEKSLEDDIHTDAQSASESRRRFVKGSLGVAPVLMTLTSRPAWGAVCAPSGLASGNASYPNPNPETECATGFGPDAYNSGTAPWPSGVDDKAYFDQVFGVGPHSKLKQILGQPQNYSEFERASVAALLNAAAGLMPYLGTDLEAVATIICMVNDVYSGGYYCAAFCNGVGTGVEWTQQQVLDYFKLTFSTL
jgi:hypothetical protein